MESKAGFYITQIKQISDRIFDKILKQNEISLTGGQGRILYILWKHEQLTMSALSQHTSLAKNSLTVVIEGMVQKGLVCRKQNPDNRRETIISLTEHSKNLREKYEFVSKQMNDIYYHNFSLEEQQQFESYLFRILHNLTKAESER